MLGPTACVVLTDTPKAVCLGKFAVRADQKGHKLAQLLVERPVTRAKDIKKPARKQRFRVEMTEDTAAFVAIGIEKNWRNLASGVRSTNKSFNAKDRDMTTSGRCLCGACRFDTQGAPKWTGYCHCDSCRRNCSAPVTAFFGVADGKWSWTGKEPATYQASDHATRYFCDTCGTPMAYRSTRYPNEIHFYAASLDDPRAFTPKNHFHYGERLTWMTLHDDLPKHGTTAGEGFADD